jgi:hypothetical protein
MLLLVLVKCLFIEFHLDVILLFIRNVRLVYFRPEITVSELVLIFGHIVIYDYIGKSEREVT